MHADRCSYLTYLNILAGRNNKPIAKGLMIAAYVVPGVLVAIVLVVVVCGWISISRWKNREAKLIV